MASDSGSSRATSGGAVLRSHTATASAATSASIRSSEYRVRFRIEDDSTLLPRMEWGGGALVVDQSEGARRGKYPPTTSFREKSFRISRYELLPTIEIRASGPTGSTFGCKN